MYSKDRALKKLGMGIWRNAPLDSNERTVRPGAKRKAHEALSNSGDTSEPEFEPPQKGSPLEPAPVLDPELDLLIDTVLAAGDEFVLSPAGRRQGASTQQHPVIDSSPESVVSQESSEFSDNFWIENREAILPLDPATDSLIDSVLAGSSEEALESLDLDDGIPVASPDQDIDVLIESLLAREEEELLSDVKTHDGQPLSPLDADVDALIDSVLAGGKDMLFAETQRIFEGGIIWDEGSSFSPTSLQFPEDGDGSDENYDGTSTAEMKSETALSSPQSGIDASSSVDQLSSPQPLPQEGTGGLEADDWMEELEDLSESAKVPSSTEVVPELPKGRGKPMEGESTSKPPGTPSAEGPVEPEEEQETEEPAMSSPASSSGASTALPVPSGSPGRAMPQKNGAGQQTASASSPIVAGKFLNWLQSVYPGVSDQVLLTHPLYRFPKRKMVFRMKSFNTGFAAALRSFNFSPISVLGECRILFQKDWLNVKDYEALMAHTERLCGYASGFMNTKIGHTRLRKTIDTLATILIIVDTLHCLTELLGKISKKETWWPWIVKNIESARFTPYIGTRVRKRSRELDLAVSLDFAIEYYRRGRRAPPRLLIGLKEAIFFGSGPTKFSGSSWDLWREEVEAWREKLPGNGLAGEQAPQPSTSSNPSSGPQNDGEQAPQQSASSNPSSGPQNDGEQAPQPSASSNP
ncbi:hypothetical protein, conserved [Eimeria brunetti]|uniref:Uncharacterized protein n=1 Tax=Eimeria brunetti TaxID=51314 RepID=U6LAP8_9EIME|nr:hypothetical protein, conserved [Eimeria brunetti]